MIHKHAAAILLLLLFSGAAAPADDAQVWRQNSFAEFSKGSFGDGGANTYVSAKGQVELINRWDLNCDGNLDLVFANSHSHVEKLDATIYWGNGKDFDDRHVSFIPNQGAQRSAAADLDGDGKMDAVMASYTNGTWSKCPSTVYFGGKGNAAAAANSRDWKSEPFVRKCELPTEAAQSVVVADLNCDGQPDLVFAQSAGFWEYRGSNTALRSPCRIFWGSPAGFAAEKHTDVEAAGASDVAVADLNQDGWPDLVIANRERAGQFDIPSYVYWGSQGGFSPDRRVELPTRQANAVQLCDVNGDGQIDVIFANGQGRESYVYLNHDGHFDASSRVELPTSEVRGIAIADFNGDGKMDIFFTNHQTAGNPLTNSYLYWGSENGFSSSNRQELETIGAWGTCAADLNGDGRPELIVCNDRDYTSYDVPSYIYWNSPKGFSDVMRTSLFTRGAVGCTVADFNGDGHPDLLINNTTGRVRGGVSPAYVYWGDPKGQFSASRRLELPGVEAYGWAAADLNDDGWPELIIANEAETGRNVTENFIYWGAKDGYAERNRTALLGNASKDAAVADLDRDGYLDVIIVNSTKAPGIFIYWGGPEGFITTQRTELPGTGSGAATLADLNGDGALDLIINGTETKPARIVWGDNTRHWDITRGIDIAGSENTSNSEVADINRDGHLDLLLIHRGTGASYVYYGDGKGNFGNERRTIFHPLECQGVTVADVNQDGWLDVVCPAYKNGGTRATMSRIFLGGPDGISDEHKIELPTNGGTGSQVADFNHDGFNDLLLTCHRSEGDPDVAGAVSDHVTDSFLYWGSKDGFNADRKLLIPTRGAHYDAGVDLGNISDRSYSFDYFSSAHEFAHAGRVKIEWRGQTPNGSSLKFQIRMAPTRDQLERAEWGGKGGAKSLLEQSGESMALPTDHGWIEYRAVLGMSAGGATPALEDVTLTFEESK